MNDKRDQDMIETQKDFFEWIDSRLNAKIPKDVIAFVINIYESPFKIELIGSNEFDPDDEDWACNTDWLPEKRMIEVANSLYGDSWQEAENNIFNLAAQYLKSAYGNATKLDTAKAFAVGFVDGNLRYVIDRH